MPESTRKTPAAKPRSDGLSAVDAVARRILDLIRDRGLKVGDALPTERELGALCDASRNTVREALRTIRTYGLIDSRPRVGAVVADGGTLATHNFLAARMDVTRSSFRDIQGFRRIIEVGIGEPIIVGASAAEIDALDAVNDRIVASRSEEEAARHDFALHLALVRLAGNRTLVDMYAFLSPVVVRIMTIGKAMKPVLSDTRRAHAEIIAALRARDRIAYAYLMSRHLDSGLKFLPEEADPGAPALPPPRHDDDRSASSRSRGRLPGVRT